MKKVVLLDGDTVVYSAALSAETPIEWDDSLWTLHAFLDEAIDKFDRIIGEIKEALEPDQIIVALSDATPETRWRTKVMPMYKANRKKTRRPVVWAPLRAYCHEKYETFEREGLEGDDILGILATHKSLVKGEKIVVSIDKDLKTIPGKLFNYGKPEEGVQERTEAQADYWHMYQTLTGDTTDNYPGCPGVGPVGATKLLDKAIITPQEGSVTQFGPYFEPELAWPIIVAAYEKAGLGEEAALQNAQVARILRASDYDFKKKAVKLWTP